MGQIGYKNYDLNSCRYCKHAIYNTINKNTDLVAARLLGGNIKFQCLEHNLDNGPKLVNIHKLLYNTKDPHNPNQPNNHCFGFEPRL